MNRRNRPGKGISALLLVFILVSIWGGCGKSEAGSEHDYGKSISEAAGQENMAGSEEPEESPEPVDVRIMALKGPTAMGMVKLMEDAKQQSTADGKYQFEIVASADEVTPKLVQGTADIVALPANLASILYNNTDGGIQVLAVNTLGVLYIVENGDTIHFAADLKGKTIYASGKGSTPEYALNYILNKNGLTPGEDVTIEWKSEHAECVAAVVSDPSGIAMLPQPFVTAAQAQDPSLRTALDLTEEWEKQQGKEDKKSAMITGVTVVRTEFAQKHPKAVKDFLDKYKMSVEYVNMENDDAARLVGAYGIVPEEIAKTALPECNIVCLSGGEMKERLSGYLAVLYEQNPQSIGGSLPGDDFYYAE